MSDCFSFVQRFTRPVRGRPRHLLLDSFDFEFCVVFNFDDSPEDPEAAGTCDIQVVHLPTNDVLADSIRLIANADKGRVIAFLDVLGLDRFSHSVRIAVAEETR